MNIEQYIDNINQRYQLGNATEASTTKQLKKALIEETKSLKEFNFKILKVYANKCN